MALTLDLSEPQFGFAGGQPCLESVGGQSGVAELFIKKSAQVGFKAHKTDTARVSTSQAAAGHMARWRVSMTA